ncbi:hypothetical protein 3 [Kummerowia striatad enamovirus]|uniref:Coat protein n=1 Tax=Kummerowia striatad enamovirus TaxID=2738918 RepID=A0A6M6R253_9VIRU|nr:hypothetical protein 3 [Kummerowia striatad enamovirus]
MAGGKGKKKRGPIRPRPRPQPVNVVVNTAGTSRQNSARKSRKGRSRANSSGSTPVTTREFVTEALKGNASGYIVIGPDNAQAGWIKGLLQAYHHYIVESLTLHWMSSAPMTAGGVMSYEIDTRCTGTGSNVPVTHSFKLTANGQVSFPRSVLAVHQQYESDENQLRILYKGSGNTDTCGYFRVVFRLRQINPK